MMSHTVEPPSAAVRSTRRRREVLVVGGLAIILAAMTSLVAASVPLYRLFCQATGINGTTRVAAKAPGAAALSPITVRFDTNVASDLPWRFTPSRPIEVRLGEQQQVAFTATNLGPEPILGTATFNVTPGAAGAYFNKIQCFCFTEQLLMPGETKQLPVVFFVDPALAKNRDARSIETITLSYTFFRKGPAALQAYLRQHPAPASLSARETR